MPGRRTPIPAFAPSCNADQRAAIQNADRSFTDRILSSYARQWQPVNADAEVNKGGRPAPQERR